MGCSNPHPHGKIWAQNSIPEVELKKQKQQQKYWEENKKSLLSIYISQEIEKDQRIILKNNHFVALVPYWAVWPYETMLVPIKHHQHIDLLSDQTSCHAAYDGGYCPQGLTFEQRTELLKNDKETFIKKVNESLMKHYQAINQLVACC